MLWQKANKDARSTLVVFFLGGGGGEVHIFVGCFVVFLEKLLLNVLRTTSCRG